jgi:hypothetical protein
VYPQQYGGRVMRIPKEPPYIPTSLGRQVSLTFRGKVNEGKFVLNIDFTRKYMHAETLALLTKPLYFPNMKYLK